MNRSRFIGGIICLAAAALIALLTFVLSADSMMFTIGDENMPIVPAIILGLVGVALLATARKSDKDEKVTITEEQLPLGPKAEEKMALNQRLESIGWGLFLVMLGGFALIPDDQIPKGVWSIGVGTIMIGLNATRAYYGIRMSGFTTVLGILAVLSGITQLLGMHSLDGAFLLIILGAYLILKPWFEKKQLFGDVAEG